MVLLQRENEYVHLVRIIKIYTTTHMAKLDLKPITKITEKDDKRALYDYLIIFYEKSFDYTSFFSFWHTNSTTQWF